MKVNKRVTFWARSQNLTFKAAQELARAGGAPRLRRASDPNEVAFSKKGKLKVTPEPEQAQAPSLQFKSARKQMQEKRLAIKAATVAADQKRCEARKARKKHVLSKRMRRAQRVWDQIAHQELDATGLTP